MKSIEEFFGKSASKISKLLKQKFNIYSKYENRMSPKDYETLGKKLGRYYEILGKKLANKYLKGSSQSLAQGLNPDSIESVKSRYGEKFSIKANSKPEAESYTTNINNWTRLPDFPQSQGQHHRFYVNPTEKKILVNYRNEGRTPIYYLYDVKPQIIESMRHKVLKRPYKNEWGELTIGFNKYMMSIREYIEPGIKIKNPK